MDVFIGIVAFALGLWIDFLLLKTVLKRIRSMRKRIDSWSDTLRTRRRRWWLRITRKNPNTVWWLKPGEYGRVGIDLRNHRGRSGYLLYGTQTVDGRFPYHHGCIARLRSVGGYYLPGLKQWFVPQRRGLDGIRINEVIGEVLVRMQQPPVHSAHRGGNGFLDIAGIVSLARGFQ